MLSSIAKQVQVDYEKKFEDFRESSFKNLEDYEIDNLDKNCEEFLKSGVSQIKSRVVSFDIKVVIAFMIIGTIANYIMFIYFNEPQYFNYFWYFEILAIVILVFWLFFLSPLRTHSIRDKNGLKDDKTFLKYRGIITPGKSILNQLKDNGTKYIAFSCVIIACVAIFSVFEDSKATQYLNVVYLAYPEISIGTIPSTIPVILVLFMIANVIGFFTISYHEQEDKITGKRIQQKNPAKYVLIGLFIILIVINLMLAIQYGTVSGQFWGDANPFNTSSDEAFAARFCTVSLYIVLFLGAIGISIMATLGLSGLEGGYIKMLYRLKSDSLPPEEDVWEFNKTKIRHDEEKKCLNRTRVIAAIELVVTIGLAVWGYWTLWWYSGDGPAPRNDLIYNLMIAELVVLILWVFIFSPYVQYRYERKYYWKDPHHNWGTVALEERGVGSPRTYFREDRKKRKKTISYLIYFNLLGLWGLSFNTGRSGGGDTDVMSSIHTAIGGTESAVFPTMLVIYIVLNLIALIYTSKITILDNSGEGKGYKFVLLIITCLLTFSSILIAFAYEDRLIGFNWVSLEFAYAMLITSAMFVLFTVVLYFLIFPLAVRLDNLEASKKDLLIITINTIILMVIFVLIFDFFLPMTDGNGNPIIYRYPFRDGAENDASYKLQNFDVGGYLVHWYGYLWWGAIQQFLFMSYFLNRIKRVFPNSRGFIPAAFSSCIFGIIHFPDWPLMVFTGLGGLLWAYFWQKKYVMRDGRIVYGNNLYLWGMVHGFGATLVYYLIPITMSVGPFNA